MAYTTPKTWVTGEALTATDMNTYIGDNLAALKNPPTDLYDVDESADYTTTSTSFVDIDATDLALTITTTGGDVIACFVGTSLLSTAGGLYFNVDVDGVAAAGEDGITMWQLVTANQRHSVGFAFLIQGLSAASHTFKLQWKVNGAVTGTLYAGAGTSNYDLHPQFWVREL